MKRKMFHCVVLLLIVFSFQFVLYAEEKNNTVINTGPNSQQREETQPQFNYGLMSLGMAFNTKDFLLGLDLGFFVIPTINLAIVGSFYVRPYKKSVYREISDNTYYQLKETIYICAIGLEKYIFLNKYLGIYAGAGIAGVYHDIAGMNSFDDFKKTVTINAGIIGRMYNVFLKIGYQYIKIEQSPHNQAKIALSLML